jgi:hypothetical protein
VHLPATRLRVATDTFSYLNQVKEKVMDEDITSWAIAVLLVSLPFGWLTAAFCRHEDKTEAAFSTREDLLAHLSAGPLHSPWVCWLLVVIFGGFYVVAVRLVAYLLRGIAS